MAARKNAAPAENPPAPGTAKAEASPDAVVRAKAAELGAAIAGARAAGYVVTWPGRPEGLAGIAVSETAKVRRRG